jgi:hypothetical protein
MSSTLAPFGTRIQLYRGVRISNVEVQAVFYGSATSWAPSGNSTGVLCSTLVDPSDGSLTLGPASAANLNPSATLYPSSTLYPY